ncbi:MAG: hypothetical protein KDC34_19450 [Saprospiraceae bacterium]|nr:hypothetical protein [Saprospiraceae bacterium]
MKIQILSPGSIFILIFLLGSCNRPEVVESESISGSGGQSAASELIASQNGSGANVEHEVVVEETLDAEKYTYMYVDEKGEKFWIAISKSPIKVGKTYYYRGGLLKRNFQSKEHNRVFETLYLVSDIRETPFGMGGGSAVDQALSISGDAVDEGPINVELAEGAVPISEVVSNAAKYEGKLVKVTGKCIKINPMIMGRNWVHLKDGSGEDVELTITTMENIPLGAVVSFEGIIGVNRDFGAGYRYDVIMEDAALR